MTGLAKAEPLSWQEKGVYREAMVNKPLGQTPGFTLLSSQATGVQFTNTLARARMMNANLLNGAGVASGVRKSRCSSSADTDSGDGNKRSNSSARARAVGVGKRRSASSRSSATAGDDRASTAGV